MLVVVSSATLAILLLMVSSLVKFKIGERRFQRRNVAGLQVYSSYGKAVGVRFVETSLYRIATILQWLAILALVGVAIMIFHQPR